jgi:myo-inositol-1(or 4)-monophosphatase
MELARWLDTFRRMGRMAGELATPLAGTTRGRRALGRGAAGDTTLYIDRVLEKLVVREAERAGNVRLISEEMGMRDFGRPQAALVVDPLDGSANADSGIGFFAVSYALGPPEPTLGDIRLGYVRNIVSGEEYWAVKGEGAFCNGRRIKRQRGARIQTQTGMKLRLLLLEMSPGPVRAFERARKIVELAQKVRCLGSMALDMCYVASSAASALVDLRGGLARPLDISAGKLILEEAGGVVTDAEGAALDGLPIDLAAHTDILASANRLMHRRLLRAKG